MITREELAAVAPTIATPTIATPKGRMKCSSLRPGDFLAYGTDKLDSGQVCVTVNSAKLQRACLYWGFSHESSWEYDGIGRQFQFVGHGKRRRWHRFLPRWIAKNVCEFNKP